ncbi:hypothetical protein RB68_036 [Enterobacteria phage RB68]|uniref:Uncharacterized protein n=3 Tax=Tequatrovirus TaxID=10663 RepID=D4Z9I3_BPAR1|nr:hypothetical protein [Escherichia coli]YP_002853991.1 gp61.2 hypothetical protein [Enterobacteria phage RB51]YP_007004778.1 hypothetical protein F412_gp238 [Escherichia phage wV7]YP_009167405.1 hypothetical protein RB68_036 [Enterobacteria phage RB68]YP_009167848.1 hypothetical protein AR1_037 [Escherichia phage AR1]AKE46051.1 hypothetical protein ECTP7_01184 [Escherichia coli O157 typing phage 7]UJJ74420.1 hypothetical protein CPTAc3_036 [Enterobacteria phage Ac3]URY15213.1 hypothetical 
MIYYMHKNPPFKYGKFPDAQCYNITPDENNRGYLIGTIFVIVKDNEIVAWADFKGTTHDVNPVPFTYYNIMDLAYDYNWFNHDTLAHIEGVGFDISYSSYSLCPMSRAHKEPEYFSFRKRVNFKRNTEYVGGIFVKDNRIIRINYPLSVSQKDIDVDLDFTENNINHIASVYFGIDHKIVICGYELPFEEQSKVNVSIDDQIFNAFMNKG